MLKNINYQCFYIIEIPKIFFIVNFIFLIILQNLYIDVVRNNRHRFPGGVVHSFTGTLKELEKILELNLYIGVNGLSLKTKENLEVVK